MTKKRSTSKTDDDNDLIDRHAFVCYELVALGLVKEETMDMLNNKFDKMDEQGDGFISLFLERFTFIYSSLLYFRS